MTPQHHLPPLARPTLRQEMLQAASRGAKLLGAAREQAAAFFRGHQNGDGGFRGRAASSDLYYTVFATEGLTALGADLPREPLRRYLETFGTGEGLDLVHLACLARGWADLAPAGLPPDARREVLRRIGSHRSPDGGYGPVPGAERGTVYGGFFALGACQDLGAELPDARSLLDCLSALRTRDGGYANEHGLRAGSTPATAAAITLRRHLGQPTETAAAEWLLARFDRESGGFLATPSAPVPDLLSTATALHALGGAGVSLDPVREPCSRFVDALRTDPGGFLGTWLDDAPDCEYTFYALLALGAVTDLRRWAH